MVVYIQKRLNIFECIPIAAGAEGEGWLYGEPATVSDMPHQAPPTCNFWLRPCFLLVFLSNFVPKTHRF